MSSDGNFDPVSIHRAGKVVVFINDGIHPGEPPGVDASIEFSENVLSGKDGLDKVLDHTVICIIPMYNTGGALNRGPYNRANQTTPPESGFRGNAQNLDLNRDFIKMDSKNSQSLVHAFHKWSPEVFLDTHVTDGSDHQYVITLIPTIFQRLPEPMSRYFKEVMIPSLFQEMKKRTYELIPYVNWVDRMKPERGLSAYYDAPRVSTGFASLFNTYAFMTENHVYKDFRDQVKSVYQFIVALTGFSNKHAQKIIETKKLADQNAIQMQNFTWRWRLDTTRFDKIQFKGFKGVWKESPLTGVRSYYYDKQQPFTNEIPLYQYFLPGTQVKKPAFYIIPQAWDRAIQHLKWNGVQMERLQKDTLVGVEVYYITDAKFAKQPNNGHFRIEKIQTRTTGQKIQFREGDYVIPIKARIIVATNRNIQKLVDEGKFREDLFYRLNVVTINVPPLRDRKEDIPQLLNHFLNKINLELHKNVSKISKRAMDLLINHDWVGNVRELENTLMQAIVLSNGDVLEEDNILLRKVDKMHSEFDDITKYTLADIERKHIGNMLKAVHWDKPKAAKYLGISLPTLYSKIENYDIKKP